jgi:hypothetical protein
MIFRWTLWGNLLKDTEMLFYSIMSFKKQFGEDHDYILYTDNSENIPDKIKKTAKVRIFPKDGLFNIQSKATWLKWCPNSRLDVSKTEFYIDSDVFLVRYPTEIMDFLQNDKLKFAILDEFKGEYWQHGIMHKKAKESTPYLNAGFFIQKAGYDITPDLLKQYEWWRKNFNEEDHTHHDEQGALVIALEKYFESGELFILPKNKYALISDDQNVDINNLDKITLFHATWPKHPAFYRFLPDLKKIISI